MNDAPKRRSRVQQEQPVERTGSHRSRRSRGGRKNGKALYYAVLVILVGVLVFEILKIALQFMGVESSYTYIAQGLVIIVAVALDLRKYLARK